jgi:endonuclease YncB( thermonuclease family)
MNVNQELVKQGWCWWYQKYAPGDTVLEGLEHEARETKEGLWVDSQPVPPWEWRAQRRDAAKGNPHAQYKHPNPYAETHLWFVYTVSMVPL